MARGIGPIALQPQGAQMTKASALALSNPVAMFVLKPYLPQAAPNP